MRALQRRTKAIYLCVNWKMSCTELSKHYARNDTYGREWGGRGELFTYSKSTLYEQQPG